MTLCACDPSTMGSRNRSITEVFWLPAQCQIQWEMLSRGIGEAYRKGDLASSFVHMVKHMLLHTHVHLHHTHIQKGTTGGKTHAINVTQEPWRRNDFLEFRIKCVDQEHLSGQVLPGILNPHKHRHSKSSLAAEAHRSTPSHSIYIAQTQTNGKLGNSKFLVLQKEKKIPTKHNKNLTCNSQGVWSCCLWMGKVMIMFLFFYFPLTC